MPDAHKVPDEDMLEKEDGREPSPPKVADLEAGLAFLEGLAADRERIDALPDDARERLFRAASEIQDPDMSARRKARRRKKRERKAERIRQNEAVLETCGIRSLRAKPVFTTPNVYAPRDFVSETIESTEARELIEPEHCYICKQHFAKVHHFYDQLCPSCADFNFAKRSESADLHGRVALLTGGRVKIGYQAGIKLLRAGARLIVTTRFPRDAAKRYAQEEDFETWQDRLRIYGLDLRHTPSVEAFCTHFAHVEERLDYIVNNACQTVRRPPDFYRHMMEGERASAESLRESERVLLGDYHGLRGYHMLPEGNRPALAPSDSETLHPIPGLTHAAELSQTELLPEERVAQGALFPQGRLDQDLQQVDLRERNSWRLLLAEVPTVEVFETQLVNAIAPFVLNARLKPVMLRTQERDKHIVNVSAVEGQFYRPFKTTRHPHTNMAKAALNMMTRTSAAEYHADGIHMNSVDTGWVTDEDPRHIAERKTEEHRFHPPLDIVDGAARIVDPILDGANTGRHFWGQFLKDYKPTDW